MIENTSTAIHLDMVPYEEELFGVGYRHAKFQVGGVDSFVSIDETERSKGLGHAHSEPRVNLVGSTISAVPIPVTDPILHFGDLVEIEGKTYRLVTKRERYWGNGDVILEPVA